ncbi:MAG: AsmA family protein [Gammaproteobacteria bacterium]|nr:AsmA family protein [Gammaproteobacteria bacterium]
MKTILRFVGILLGTLAIVVAVAALILPRVFDPNNYRDRISALVKEKTGRELVIAGEIGWSVFPWLGVELGEVRLANAAGFGDEPFARIAAVQVRVKLLPLLRKEVEMSTVLLDGLQVNLAKAKDGRSNWADLLPAQAATGAARDKPPAAASKSGESYGAVPLAALAIGGVRVRDARLLWDDRAAGTQQLIEDLNVQLGAIRLDQPVAVAMDFVAKGGAPAVESMVKLSGQVTPTQAFKHIAVRDLEASVAAHGKGLPRGRLDADLKAHVVYALDRRTLEINDLVLNAFELGLRGQARGADLGGEAPRFSGDLRLEPCVPRDVLQALGQPVPETSDRDMLGKAEAAFAFQATPASVQVSNLKLRLDDSGVTGTFGINDFTRPVYAFKLAVDNLDLDRYLPPRKDETANAASTVTEDDESADAPGAAGEKRLATTDAKAGTKVKTKAKRKAAAGLFPEQTLRGLNLDGRLNIGTLKAYRLRSSDVDITVSAKGGLVQVFPARANMYQGTYNGNITVDVRGKQPRLAMDEKVAGVQAEPLLTDLLGKAKVTGSADVALKLTAVGNHPRAIRKTLDGNARFAFSDGVIKGMDVLGEIRKAYALLRGKPQPAGNSGQTEFSAITGTATVTKGVVNNPDLLGKSPLMQAQGKGTANLVTQQLDYRVTATLVDSLEGKGELTGRPIPVHITGTFADPKVGVDLENVLKQEVKKQLQKKLQDKLKGGALKGLFGR